MCAEYTWDDIYERANGTGYGDSELVAKDKEIDSFLWRREKPVLFDVDGNIIKK